MNQIKLNETPIRTSKNFNINNIKLENISIPNKIVKFDNLKIIGDSDSVQIKSDANNLSLVYGLGQEIKNISKDFSNKNIQINANKNIELDFKFDKNNLILIDNIDVVAEENSNTTIILKYESETDKEIFRNGILKVSAKENSNINIIIVNLLNLNANNFMSIENTTEDNAVINYTLVDLGGKATITNLYSNIVGKSSANNINAIYLGKESQLIDLNYIGEIRGQKADINIEVQGALKDNAKKHFKGTIDFKRGCKKATGNENEQCMLLSNTAKSIALPMLLCSEEDVEGNHSTSAGKIEDKELFYIMSRGFTKTEAIKLMVKAKFSQILENISNEELREEISKEIDTRLD